MYNNKLKRYVHDLYFINIVYILIAIYIYILKLYINKYICVCVYNNHSGLGKLKIKLCANTLALHAMNNEQKRDQKNVNNKIVIYK